MVDAPLHISLLLLRYGVLKPRPRLFKTADLEQGSSCRFLLHVERSAHLFPDVGRQRVVEKQSHAVYLLSRHDVARLDVVNYISHGLSKISEEKTDMDEAAKIEGAEFLPDDLLKRSYFLMGICGEDTDRPCPDPSLPMPLTNSGYINNDGQLVLPPGVQLPKVVPLDRGN